MQNVDFDFIIKREGYRLRGYVPNAEKSKSGVTIASGFDLGARKLSDLKGLPQDIVDLLKPFLGFKGAEAQAIASDLVISDPQGKIINEFAKKEALQNLSRKWEDKTGTKFEDLPKNKATVIASVAFQYGDLASETPNFWRQVTSDDWDAAVKNLRDFGDDYDSRRELEADYFEAGLAEQESESKKKFEQELQRAKQLGIQVEEGALTKDLSNQELVDLVQNQIRESRGVQEITATPKGGVDAGEFAIETPAEESIPTAEPATPPEEIIRDTSLVDTDSPIQDDPIGEEGDLATAPTFSGLKTEEVEPPIEEIPMPEEGSFEALFGGARYSQIQAEDSFALPEGHEPDENSRQEAEAERHLYSIDAGFDAEVVPFQAPQEKKYSDRLPEAEDLQPEFEFYGGKRRYGEVHRSRIGEDQYDYSMFMPTFGQTASAAFRQFNIFPALQRLVIDQTIGNEEGYSAYNDATLKEKVGEDGLLFFRHSLSHRESMEKLRRFERDLKDSRIVAAGKYGTELSVGAALADPSLALPFTPARFLGGNSRAGRAIEGFGYGVLTSAPQQLAIETTNESRDANFAAYGVFAAGVLGSSFNVAFGRTMSPQMLAKQKLAKDNYDVNFLKRESSLSPTERQALEDVAAGRATAESAGAAVSPEVARTNMYRQLEQEALAETGIGLENIPWNPTVRLFKSSNPIVRNIAPAMVDVGGLMQKKVLQGVEMEQSVETTFRTTYYPTVLEAVRASDTAYLRYRSRNVPQGEIGRSVEMMKVRMGDTFSKETGYITEVQFRNRIGMAMARGDVDNIGDAASPFVTEAARGYRKVFDQIKDEATKVRLFERELVENLNQLRARNASPRQIAKAEADLQRLRTQGVTVNTALSYVPRIYRIDKIEANTPRFLGIVRQWAMSTKRMSRQQADNFAGQVLDTVTRRRPFIDYSDATDALDFIKNPSGIQARSLEIPDELIEEFLERDIEALMRNHVKTMGMDIELTKKFGSSDMSDVIKQVEVEAQRLIDETPSFERRGELAKELQDNLRDIRGLRDRLRGTYGASKDPHAMSSRFVRVMKSFNVLTAMGSAVISSIPDVARIAMVEGFNNAYGKGFALYFDDIGRTVRQMSKPELEKAAVGVDAALGLRAHAMTDMGDLFGNRYTIERTLNDATGMFFFLNGLNMWNQVLKEIAGNVTMLRMTESIMKSGGYRALTDSEKTKLLKNGIGRQDYDIMRKQIEQHGEQVEGQWMPNTEAWTFATQRLRFRNALNQNVDRIIITPGAGDRALWTSTELGSLLTQFKSYGQSATQRMLTAGLQEKDGAFWQGAFLIVGLAAIVNEIKRVQYGMDSPESPEQKLLNAIDRSGLLGFFTDVNNGIEKVSDYKLGMRPFLTDQESYPVYAQAKAGAVVGPTGSALVNSLNVLGDVAGGNFDYQTASDLRFIFPTGSLFYMDPIYDGIFGDGNPPTNVNRQQ